MLDAADQPVPAITLCWWPRSPALVVPDAEFAGDARPFLASPLSPAALTRPRGPARCSFLTRSCDA